MKDEINNLCPDCQARYEKNPLRILDCKVDTCKNILEREEIKSVINSDYICEECANHFDNVKELLQSLNINYVENKMLVRGLDYYNRTVFEIKSNNLGSQNAVCGGGRYDNLVATLGGVPTPAVGWAMGMERLISLIQPVETSKLDAFVVSNLQKDAIKLVEEIREKDFPQILTRIIKNSLNSSTRLPSVQNSLSFSVMTNLIQEMFRSKT